MHGDERARTDDAAGADLCAVHDGGTHAHKHFTGDGACVDDGTMTDRDEFSQVDTVIVGEMNYRAILNIGTGADMNAINISAQHCLEPDAGFFFDGDIAHDVRAGGDESCGMNGGRGVEMPTETFFESHQSWSGLESSAAMR